MGNFANAETHLATVINTAASAGVSLEANFADVVTDGSSEVLFATQVSSSVPDEYGFTEFTGWFIGNDSKAFEPLDPDLTAAFDAAGDVTRKALTIDEVNLRSVKYVTENPDQDFIELRLSDVILLYAEALNENTNTDGSQSASILELLDDMEDRFIDNCDFFNINAPEKLSDEEFYKLMMTEFPNWLKEAKEKRLVQSNK